MIGNDCVNQSVSDRDCSHCIWHTSGQCANWNCEPVSREEALEALEKVKKMVLCKDCKYWEKTWTYDWAEEHHYCPMIDGIHKGDFYCADAERRTDD